MRGPLLHKIPFLKPRIVSEAHKVLKRHWDPFDAFIITTVRAYGYTIVSKDQAIRRLYGNCVS